MLEIKNLNVFYGVIHAIQNVSFSVPEGQIVTLIGANGAGKSTILKSISRIIDIKSGEMSLFDTSLSSLEAHQVVELGISHVPEGRRVFPDLTVIENLELGAYTRKDKSAIAEDLNRVYTYFPKLKERFQQLSGTLSGGEQQMLAIGRALMSRPKILLLDEPSMGLAPLLVDEIFKIIEEINREGTTILLVEQNANRALSISNYGFVLETGKIIVEGSSKKLMNDPKVIEAYLST